MARTLILLFARALPAQTASGKDANGAGQAAPAPPPQSGGIEVLSDTNGVDLGPYRKDLKHDVKEHWYKLANAIAPQSERLKKGTVAIEFTVGRDGAVLGMGSWRQQVKLSSIAPPGENHRVQSLSTAARGVQRRDTPASLYLLVQPGRRWARPGRHLGQHFTFRRRAGGGWRNEGLYRNGYRCGKSGSGLERCWRGLFRRCLRESDGGSYHAPSVLPNPPVVSLMASSQVDDNAYTSVTIHIVKKQGD